MINSKFYFFVWWHFVDFCGLHCSFFFGFLLFLFSFLFESQLLFCILNCFKLTFLFLCFSLFTFLFFLGFLLQLAKRNTEQLLKSERNIRTFPENRRFISFQLNQEANVWKGYRTTCSHVQKAVPQWIIPFLHQKWACNRTCSGLSRETVNKDFVLRVSIESCFNIITCLLKELHNILGWSVKKLKDFVLEIILEAWINIWRTCKYVSYTMLLKCFLVVSSTNTSLEETPLWIIQSGSTIFWYRCFI